MESNRSNQSKRESQSPTALKSHDPKGLDDIKSGDTWDDEETNNDPDKPDESKPARGDDERRLLFGKGL